jgi:hypothetical protein
MQNQKAPDKINNTISIKNAYTSCISNLNIKFLILFNEMLLKIITL